MTTVDASYLSSAHALSGAEAPTVEARAAPQSIQRGQSLAALELEETISKIRRWAREGRLNRGLRLSLPYYDDHAGEMRWRDIDVIPRGRIPFVPAFLVLAVHREAKAIDQQPRLTASTREHLMGLLRTLQRAFGPVPEEFEI